MGKVVKDDVDDEVAAVAAEVDVLRTRTERIVAELEARVRNRYQRLRRAVDVRAQLSAHPAAAASAGTLMAIGLGLAVFLSLRRRRAARRPMARLAGRLSAYRALLAHPERAVGEESLGKRVIVAALVAGATILARGLGGLALLRAFGPRAHGPRALPASSRR